MDKELYSTYVAILKEELIPAMGCTEPIAIAYGAALARRTLGQEHYYFQSYTDSQYTLPSPDKHSELEKLYTFHLHIQIANRHIPYTVFSFYHISGLF